MLERFDPLTFTFTFTCTVPVPFTFRCAQTAQTPVRPWLPLASKKISLQPCRVLT